MLCFLYATLCFICCYLLRCCTCRELCLPALFSSSAFCFVLLYPFHHGSVPAAASVVMQSHGFFVAPCLLQLFGYALQMSQQSIDRVRRVRASRERRATNVLLRPFAMDIQSTVGTSSEPLRVDRSKRPRSLMDFSAGLSKLHRQHRCLLRSKLPPLPPPHAPSASASRPSTASSATDREYIQSLKGSYPAIGKTTYALFNEKNMSVSQW